MADQENDESFKYRSIVSMSARAYCQVLSDFCSAEPLLYPITCNKLKIIIKIVVRRMYLKEI